MNNTIVKHLIWQSVLVLSFPATLMAQEEDSDFGANVSVDLYDKFVWRGMQFNGNGVLQYTAEGRVYGLTGTVWANQPLTNTKGTRTAGEIDEVDVVLDYSRSIAALNDVLGWSVGFVHCRFMGYFSPFSEIYGGLNLDVLLSPSVTWGQAVGDIKGSYVHFGLGHAFENIGRWSQGTYANLELSAGVGLGSAGFNAGFFDVEKTRPVDLTLNAEIPFHVKYGFRVVPNFNVSTILSNDLRKAYEYASVPTNVWFGVRVAKSFSFGASAANTEP